MKNHNKDAHKGAKRCIMLKKKLCVNLRDVTKNRTRHLGGFWYIVMILNLLFHLVHNFLYHFNRAGYTR